MFYGSAYHTKMPKHPEKYRSQNGTLKPKFNLAWVFHIKRESSHMNRVVTEGRK